MTFLVGTVPPFKGAPPGTPVQECCRSPERDAPRRAVNAFLAQAATEPGLLDLDALADFDRLIAAPGDDSRLNPDHDSGDPLHPGLEGNRLMAKAVAQLILKGAVQ